MERVIVDSSVVVKWFIVEPYSTEARRILDGYQAGALALIAPDLIYAEVGNVIWKKHRFHGLAAADAQLIIQAFQGLTIALTSTAELLNDAYQLAVTHQRTVYDSLYLALGRRERCRFVTADEKLALAIGAAVPGVIWVANWV
jgi:predicted nucleic acid-binding protein